MDRVRVYSMACSIANLLLVIALTAMTLPIVTQWIEFLNWWLNVTVGVVVFLTWAFVVQWWLSIPINVILRRIILHSNERGGDR